MFEKLDNPATLPTGAGEEAKFSPDDTYLAVAHGTTPFITIYKRNGDTFTKLNNPANLPTGTAHCVGWSYDNTYLAVGHDTSPYITIYKRSGDTFTKLANPADLPQGAVDGIAWSKTNSTYLYAGVYNSIFTYGRMYKRTDDTFSKISSPENPLGFLDAAFSPNDDYFALARLEPSDSIRYLKIYKRSGDVFTLLDDPTELAHPFCISWSHDSIYLSLGQSSGVVFTYKRSGDTFTKLADPAISGSGSIDDLAYSPDSTFLACVQADPPYNIIYRRSGDVLTKYYDLSPTVSIAGNSICFSNTDSTYIAFSSTASPYISIYTNNLAVATVETCKDLQSTTLTATGNITSDGGGYTARGFEFYEKSSTITYLDSMYAVREIGTFTNIGEYEMTLSGLKPTTTYYIRAWVLNSSNLVYGDWHECTTTEVLNPAYGIHEEDNAATIYFYLSEDDGMTWGKKHGPYTTDQADIEVTKLLVRGSGKKKIKFESDVLTGISASVMVKLDLKAR